MRKLIDLGIRVGLVFSFVFIAVLLVVRVVIFPGTDTVQNTAHAGGMIDGIDYTNSLAAMTASYDDGFRIFELDFLTTSDNKTVCGHDWNGRGGHVPDFEGFLQWRKSLAYPPCSVGELRRWFSIRPDAVLISDAKTDVLKVNRELHDLFGERLIAQAYNAQQVCAFREDGIERVILTFYRMPETMETIHRELENGCVGDGALEGVTVSVEKFLWGNGILAQYLSEAPVYARTVNNCASYALIWLLGADAIYSDSLADGDCLFM